MRKLCVLFVFCFLVSNAFSWDFRETIYNFNYLIINYNDTQNAKKISNIAISINVTHWKETNDCMINCSLKEVLPFEGNRKIKSLKETGTNVEIYFSDGTKLIFFGYNGYAVFYSGNSQYLFDNN